jgi:large subunit ribosomal protein L13
MRTYSPRAKDIQKQWHVIDAEGKILGEVAVQAAALLRGKHKAMFMPSIDTGDYVIVVNAAKVAVTGKKRTEKIYYRHSGYPGGLKAPTFETVMAQDPRRIIEHAVWGMLPKNSIGRTMYRKLRVYAGADHPHQGQLIQKEGSEL